MPRPWCTTGAYPGFSEGGGPRSAKKANKPNKRASGWLVEWGFYALSASKAIFRARTYNCNLFSPVMIT